MARSEAKTVSEYLKTLPPERRSAIAAVRKVIRKNLPKGFEETMNWGMITYQVPLKRHPETYNGQPLCYAAVASQKNHMSVYLTGVYGDRESEKWFRKQFAVQGKKLDMGKSCVRFRRIEDLPLDVIGQTISRLSMDQFIERYEQARRKRNRG